MLQPDKILYESQGFSRDVLDNLHRIGYSLELGSPFNGRVEALMVDKSRGFFYGGPDPREEGVAIGY